MRLLRSRRRVSANGWRLCCASGRGSVPRFAVTVAKRHVRTAVARNRIRRLLREYFRQELRLTLPPMDFLLLSTARPPLPPQAAVLRAQCRQLFSQLLNTPH